MTIKIRLTYYGMDGEGATVREAKVDAGRKIERALAEMSKAPVIVSVDGRVAQKHPRLHLIEGVSPLADRRLEAANAGRGTR